jgi:predicted transcriptional regulator of viral defense system
MIKKRLNLTGPRITSVTDVGEHAMKKTTPEDNRALRLLDALASFISDAEFILTVSDLAKRAQVTPSVARMAIEEWEKKGWLYLFPDSPATRRYVITSSAPTAPNEAAIDALALLQMMNRNDFRLGRLCYGYGSALSYHQLTDLVQSAIYVFFTDQTVVPPNLPEDLPFKRTEKEPTLWGMWRDRKVYRIRRNPTNLRPYQREQVSYQGVHVPCTTAIKALIDCWVRPDLAGGADRVDDAWIRFLDDHAGESPAISRDIGVILRDSSWPAMEKAFRAWLKKLHADLLPKAQS